MIRPLIFILIFISSDNLLKAQPYDKRLMQSDMLDYKFTLWVSDENDTIEGNAQLTFRALQNLSELSFDLANKKTSGKGMTVSKVSQNGRSLPFRQANDMLTILAPAISGDTMVYDIAYKGVPADGLIITKNKYGHRTMFADNWPNRAHHWIPCIDNPADKASVEFIVNAPAHYQVISNGIQVGEVKLDNHFKQTHWKEPVPLPVKVMAIGIAGFAVKLSGLADGIPVYSWVYPEDSTKGFYDYALARDILPWFIENIGPYPYLKLANVESTTMFGGMENAGAIFYSENSIKGNRSNEALLAHEIAHQWFGNSATEANWQHVWLSEGFATYMASMYLEAKYGKDTLVKRMTEDRKRVINFSKKKPGPVVDSSVKSDYMQLLNANSYQKGAWALHMLRHKIGNASFKKGIKQYYAAFRGRNATTEDFEKVMENASKQNLSLFFKQWLYMPGQPDVKILYAYDKIKRDIVIEVSQDQNIPFTFPIEIKIISGQQSSTKKLIIDKRNTTLRIPASKKPDSIIADPDIKLLFSSAITEK